MTFAQARDNETLIRKIELVLNTISLFLIFLMLSVMAGLWPEELLSKSQWFLATIPYLFAIDYFIRLALRGKSYALSLDGKVDFLAFAPEIVLSFFLPQSSFSLLRTLRVFKLTRFILYALPLGKYQKFLQTIIPMMIVAVGFKMAASYLELENFWPESSHFNLAITVLGFCVAVLLGTKLSSAISRFYALEELTCKTVGTLRVLENSGACQQACLNWGQSLKELILLDDDDKEREPKIAQLRKLTDDLARIASEEKANAPALAAFSQTASLLLHRIMAPTPPAYTLILRFIMVLYISILIVAIPAPLGIYLAPVIVAVLGLIYFVADDLDNPMDYGPHSLIDVRIDALKVYVDNRTQNTKET